MDIYQNLKQDHDEVKNLLTELLSLSEKDEYRHTLIEQISSELVPHARAEELVFYNTLRASDADTGLVMHSFREHMQAEGLLRMLQTKDKVNFNWKETASKLKEELEHHIQEEESKIFTMAKSIISQTEADQIGEAFVQVKEQYKKQGAIKNTADMVLNLLPPRFASRAHDLNTPSEQ
jgi:hemerythrin superfamily protein